jgi:hypothetical protein
MSFVQLCVLGSSASFAIAACGDDGGDSVTAEELAAMCAQLEAKVDACTTTVSVAIPDCDGSVSACRSQVAAWVSCLNSPSVDVCAQSETDPCESQMSAALQCALSL